MAPRARRGGPSEAQAFHELGVRGRKTGVSLPEGGERDEHGMQPLDAIFSSPSKPAQAPDSGSENMDIASNASPGPRTLLKKQCNIRYPLTRSRSPLKTNLNSPARKNPHVERLSSPSRRSAAPEDRDATVTRKLNFSAKPRGKSARPNGLNGSAEREDSVLGDYADLDVEYMMEESLQMVEAIGDGADAHDGHSPDEVHREDEPPARRGRGRPRRNQGQKHEPPKSQPAKKRRSLRNSTGGDGAGEGEQQHSTEAEAEADDEPRQPKRRRTSDPTASKAPARPSKPKLQGRPPRKDKEAAQGGDQETGAYLVALQRGPPMPRSHGLVSVWRDADGATQTRSGRHSYRPVEYWRGEQVIREDEEQSDMFYKDDFVLPSIKEVVRVAPEAPPTRRAARAKPGRPRARAHDGGDGDGDDDVEAWELDPGTVTGEVVLWEPEHEEHPPADDEPVQVMDDRIAISAAAIQTSDIKDASFRFAKTLTMPFMGAGVVDLPAGSEKRPKNSRKMHMVFFVHRGKVLVTINEAQFRISAGGMWFVPRGNYYSITNDYDGPARIFFSQACEVPAPPPAAAESPAQSTAALGY